jgi:Uma2 family endonuclease
MVAIAKSFSAPVLSKLLRQYTLEAYLQREERSSDKSEFYNGNIIKMPNAKFYHNLTTNNTTYAIQNALNTAKLEQYFVLGDSQKVYIEAENTAVYPDALVICEKPEFYQGLEYLLVNPLVVIEVLSKSTAAYDRKDKYSLYKMLPSLQEYVLIDSRKTYVETRYQLEPDIWKSTYYKNLTDIIHLQSLQISIPMTAIYKKVVFPK